jgi:CubicO group peptidase (beta-lactamase class C family)
MLRRDFLAALAAAAAQRDGVPEADYLVRSYIENGFLESASLLVRRPRNTFQQVYGKATLESPFLIASITKPMTALGVMLLRDRRELQLTDPVAKYFPDFRGDGRERITIWHLLTHTSGLPDMLPENEELRKRHAPLDEFVARTLRTPLLFPAGEKVSYQSMGILLAAAIAEKITATKFRDYLASTVFARLGMRSASLGLGGRPVSAMVRCQLETQPTDWDWNSQYWRDLGAPWGGAHSTAADIARFLEAFREDVSPYRDMVAVQTPKLNDAWGLGLVRNAAKLGKGCSPGAWGHSGSTGTLAWHDPAANVTLVLLTSKPADLSRDKVIRPVSDTVSVSNARAGE